MKWRYGDAGDRWPVQVNQVWQAGPHLLACGDLEAGGADRLLRLAGVIPTVIYTDPPWNAGNARAFRTKAEVGRPVDFFGSFIPTLARTLGLAQEVFCEAGRREHGQVIKIVLGHTTLHLTHNWDIAYYSGSRLMPSKLLRFSRNGDEAFPDPGMQTDRETPLWALSMSRHRGVTVMDPCTGRGATAEAAHRQGMRFLGLELHPRRLACALDRLAKLGVQPEYLSPL